MINKYHEPRVLDSTARGILRAIRGITGPRAENRVISLTQGKELAAGSVVEAVGIPEYVDDVTQYAEYGITDTGWYVFARILAENGVQVTEQTAVTGAAGYIAQAGSDHVDVAVRFDVAAQSQTVTVDWGEDEDVFVFKATDLAVRNLDYMTTFYVYDIAKYTTWHYKFTPDAAFVAGTRYFTKSGDIYSPAEVETVRYILTADATFAEGKTYYTKGEDDTYTAATVTVGEAVTPDTYYEQTTVPVPAYYVQTHPYALTTDTTFQDGVTYYTKDEDDEYTAATVTVGEPVTPNTYYVQTTAYVQAEGVFETGVTYYTKSGTEYTAAEVVAGDPIPAYYVHEKVIFEGMTPNVTYKLDELVDCPIEIVLPDIPENGHGAWFEIQMRFNGTHSITLLPVTEVKIGTAQTQAQTAGINTVDLQYTAVNGVKMWTLLNTHSNIPTT